MQEKIGRQSPSGLRKLGLIPSAKAELLAGPQSDCVRYVAPDKRYRALRRMSSCFTLSLCVVLGTVNGVFRGEAQTYTETGTVISAANGSQNSVYSRSGFIPAFVGTDDRVTGESLLLSASASIMEVLNNSGDTNIYPSISGTASLTVASQGQTLSTAYLYPYGSTVIAPHSSGTVYGSASGNTSITNLGNANTYGVTVTSNLGTGPSLTTNFGLQVVYTYTLIGLTQDDPIQPNSTVNNVLTFNAAPSQRWYDPPAASVYVYTTTSPGSLFTAITLPTGTGDVFDIYANGEDYQNLAGGSTVLFASGVSSFTLTTSQPGLVPSEPTFNTSDANFTITPEIIPEPSTWAMMAGAALLLSVAMRRRLAA